MEPVYTFKKNVGWTIDVSKIYTCKCGTQVRLEERQPNLGEPWYRCPMEYDIERQFQKHAGAFVFNLWSRYIGENLNLTDRKVFTLVKV